MYEIKQGDHSFFIEDKGETLAEIDFIIGSNGINVNHTFVSEDLRGQGLGESLVRKVVELARREQMKIIPECPFAGKVIESNTQYRDVLS